MWTDAAAIATYCAVAIGLVSAGHALLNKRDPRSQLGWVVLCVAVPLFGAGSYWLLGVNRIRRRAQRWRAMGRWPEDRSLDALGVANPARAEAMHSLLRTSAAVTGRPILDGNAVEVLHNGEEAYPAMLEAIRRAERTVHMCTYIFDTDEVGREFCAALVAAGARGAEVRLLVDAIGERYSRRPRVSRVLSGQPGVSVARFHPLVFSARGFRVNLRNHRKILVVDNEIGFTGGMNIGQRHLVQDADNKKPTVDMHFRIEGPAAQFLEEAFMADWQFATGSDGGWAGYVKVAPRGSALCRSITDGPDEDLEKIQWVLIGALAAAKERVRIMTPYFIPNRELIAALISAALRGVLVEIIIPDKSNLPFVSWATDAMVWELLQHGVRIYRRRQPFAHSKLFVVDDYYSVIGSANLDPRSLRLNFEFNLEIYDSELGRELAEHFDKVRALSPELTLEQNLARSLPIRLRDATAKIFAPYL